MSGSKVREGFGRMLVLAVGPNSQQGLINTLVLQQSAAKAGASSMGTAEDEGIALIEVGSENDREASISSDGTAAAAAGGDRALQSMDSSKRLEAAAAAAASVPGDGLREQTPLAAKLEVLAGQIGVLGFSAAGAVLAINALLFTWERMAAGLTVTAPDALEVRGAEGSRAQSAVSL